jgi:uncharacterized protein YbjT (DUF2867 family)
VQPKEVEEEEEKEEGGGARGCRVLDLGQGDVVSGKISRGEVARLVATALSLPEAVGKTVEVTPRPHVSSHPSLFRV